MADNPGGDYQGARWSLNLARPPGWLAGADADVVEWYRRNVFDRSGIDTNQTLAALIDQFRAEGARLGVRTDEGDGNILINVALMDLGRQTWAAYAGAAGSAPTTGGGPNLLDQIAATQAQAVDQARAAHFAATGETDGSDAMYLAQLAAPLPAPVTLTSYRGTVVPAREAADATSWGQDSYSSPAFFSGYTAQPAAGGGGFQVSPLLVILAGAAAFFLMGRK